LDIRVERLANCQAVVTIAFDAPQIQKQMRLKARQISRTRQIPGFRPGRAPYPIVERIIGRDLLLQDAIDELFPDALAEALEEHDLDIFDEETIQAEMIEDDPPTMRGSFQTPPVVELGDYRSVRVEPEEVHIEEEEVESVLKELQEQSGTWVASLGPTEYGDLITIDLHAELLDGTTLFDHRAVQGVLEEPDEEDPLRASEPLLGTMVNQVKEYHLTFPDDYEPEHLAGRTALYKATILDIKKRELPEMTDDWAQQISPFESMAQLREEIELGLLASARREADDALLHEYLRTVLDVSKVEVPPKMVEERIDRIMGRLERDLTREGLTIDEFLESMGKETEEELRSDLRARTEESLKEDVVLLAIARENGIEVSDEEVEEEVKRSAERYGEYADQMREVYLGLREDMRMRILISKGADYALQIAKDESADEQDQPPESTANDGPGETPAESGEEVEETEEVEAEEGTS